MKYCTTTSNLIAHFLLTPPILICIIDCGSTYLRLWAWLRRTLVAAAAANAAYASILEQTDQHTAADAAAAAAAEARRTGGDNIQQWHAKQQFDDTSLDR